MPHILGFHVQIRGHGRASVSAGESAWRRAAAFQVRTFDEVSRGQILPPTAITAFGLASDTAYCFRVRACTAGGWGPFSSVSSGIRTQSAATTDSFETAKNALVYGGVAGVVVLMARHPKSGVVQRQCVEVLAKMVIKCTCVATLTLSMAGRTCYQASCVAGSHILLGVRTIAGPPGCGGSTRRNAAVPERLLHPATRMHVPGTTRSFAWCALLHNHVHKIG